MGFDIKNNNNNSIYINTTQNEAGANLTKYTLDLVEKNCKTLINKKRELNRDIVYVHGNSGLSRYISSSQITVTINSIQAISSCPESYFADINKRILQFM